MENRNKRKIVHIIYSTETTPSHGLLSNVLQNTSITSMIKKQNKTKHSGSLGTIVMNSKQGIPTDASIFSLKHPRKHHQITQMEVSQREKTNIVYVESEKKIDIDDLIYKSRNRHRHGEQTFGYQGVRGMWDELGGWD